jgi:hypothetical protein
MPVCLPHNEKKSYNEDARENVLMIMYRSKTEEIRRGWIKLLHTELYYITLPRYYTINVIQSNRIEIL